MASTGVCCANLEDPKALMKMGLSMILIGHVNFLLGALVHGAVLRHINVHKQARAMEYAISNVVALSSGLTAVVVGILAIVLSKTKRSRALVGDTIWSVFILGLLSALMATASAIGLLVSVVRAILHGGRSLLTHCRFPDAIGYSSVTNECPFDPTRIYSTTLILWVPLIVTCAVQLVFSSRCVSVCMAFLGLPCCPRQKRDGGSRGRTINAATAVELMVRPRYAPPPRQQQPPQPPQPSQPPRPRPLHIQHHSLPPSERHPLRQPRRGRAAVEDRVIRQQRAPEQDQLLERATLERSSFWI